MANSSVNKFKSLMLRHGEKALVGLTAALFVAFAAMAILNPTIEIKPEQLKAVADSADAQLQKQQDPKDILAKLEEAGIKDPHFEKLVQDQQANALKPADYRVKLDWVTPEPGAGLIRDQPELIAPTELAAFPGRGGILLYALNDKLERIVDVGKPQAVKKAPRKKRAAAQGGSMSSSTMSSMSMPGMGVSAPPPPDNSEEGKKRAALEKEKRDKLFSGKVDPAKEKEAAKAEEAPAEPQGPFKEETKGKRWVVITGVIDNEQLKKNWLLALKNPAIAYPNYKRVDVERQVLQPEGAWTDWAAIDRNKSYEVLDNLPELDTEYVPESQRPEMLNDALPFLRAGYWTGVHVARLVPAEAREAPKAAPSGMPGMSGMSGSSSAMSMQGMSMPGGNRGMGMSGGSSSAMSMQGMSMPGSMGTMGGAGTEGAISAEESNFTKNEDPTLMTRSLDFTVDPDRSYRFRIRIVAVNPNYDRTDVNPGVDVENKELIGPWSDPTEAVTLPADVAAYAQSPHQNPRRHDQVAFQVIKWDPNTGQTVLKNDEAGPGEIVGEESSVQMPSSEGGGVKMTRIDFNSRAVVLDTMGGLERLPDIGVERNQFEIPALAMVLQADGSVAIRSQALDKSDEVRDDMETNYKQSLDDSGKKREPGGGSKMPNPMATPKRKPR